MAGKKYVISTAYYRKGVTYPAGSVVELPEGVQPGRGWKPYEEPKPSAPSVAPVEPKGKSKRPSDGDPI